MSNVAKRVGSPPFKGYKRIVLPNTWKPSPVQTIEPKKPAFTAEIFPKIDATSQRPLGKEKPRTASWVRPNQWERSDVEGNGLRWVKAPHERTKLVNYLGFGTLADEDPVGLIWTPEREEEIMGLPEGAKLTE